MYEGASQYTAVTQPTATSVCTPWRRTASRHVVSASSRGGLFHCSAELGQRGQHELRVEQHAHRGEQGREQDHLQSATLSVRPSRAAEAIGPARDRQDAAEDLRREQHDAGGQQ